VVAEHTAQALPNAQLVELKDCGHFSYMERPTDVRKAIDRFLHGQRPN
jgi:pimeloyl-ACP methyl ester carboxylesterase